MTTREERAWVEVARLRLSLFAPVATHNERGEKLPRDASWHARNADASVQGFGPTPLLAIESALDPKRHWPEETPEPKVDRTGAFEHVFRPVVDYLDGIAEAPIWDQWVRAWAVAGILYEKFSHSAIPDATYDSISRFMLDWVDVEVPRPWLTAKDLDAGTAMGCDSYPETFHMDARAYFLKGDFK